jgi:uncharacterized protein YciI
MAPADRPGTGLGKPDTVPVVTEPLQFVYVFRPGERPELSEGPEAWTDADREIASRHLEYLKQGTAVGTVVVAGRSQDWVGPAIVVIEAASEAEARAFVENDPFVASGLFRADLHPFRIALHRGS